LNFKALTIDDDPLDEQAQNGLAHIEIGVEQARS
jgi:hypothetical protein